MIIGNFQKEGDSFFGNIQTMTQNVAASIKPVKGNGKEGSPTHRIYAKARSGNEIGAAWSQHSDKTGKDYLSLKLDDPYLPEPIRANLIEPEGQDGKFILMWNRE